MVRLLAEDNENDAQEHNTGNASKIKFLILHEVIVEMYYVIIINKLRWNWWR